MITKAHVISRAEQVPGENFLRELARAPEPGSVLMCPPDFFDVIDVKNPFMKGRLNSVNRAEARQQWDALRRCFEEIGLSTNVIPAAKDCEDMVFTANQVFAGTNGRGAKICILSRMKFPSRQREVPYFADWFKRNGYEIHELDGDCVFEGGGDAIWHPGRRLIWGGYGQRTEQAVYPQIAALFDAPVITLELTDPRFYHLDTCFCPLNENTALVHLPVLAKPAQGLIARVFPKLIEVDEQEATAFMTCNAAAFHGKNVVIQRGAEKTAERLREFGFQIHPVATDEFIKSGGSIFCMKTSLFQEAEPYED